MVAFQTLLSPLQLFSIIYSKIGMTKVKKKIHHKQICDGVEIASRTKYMPRVLLLLDNSPKGALPRLIYNENKHVR